MDQERTDPCIISVADTVDGKTHRVILRTPAGSHQIFIPANKIASGSKHVRILQHNTNKSNLNLSIPVVAARARSHEGVGERRVSELSAVARVRTGTPR